MLMWTTIVTNVALRELSGGLRSDDTVLLVSARILLALVSNRSRRKSQVTTLGWWGFNASSTKQQSLEDLGE